MPITKVVPTLFFAGQALEAAEHYISIFPNSSIDHTAYYPDAGVDQHGQAPGSILAVSFTLDGTRMAAINGPPMFKFTEAISFTVECADQGEVDHYWAKLTEGGDESKQYCCWLADKFGVSWQVVPKEYHDIVGGEDRQKAAKAMKVGMTWKKADLASLRKALAE